MLKMITRWLAPSLESLEKDVKDNSIRDLTIERRNGVDCVVFNGLTVCDGNMATKEELLDYLARMRDEYVAKAMNENKRIYGYK